MKSADIEKAEKLVRDLKKLRKMEELAWSFPPSIGYLHLDNAYIPIPNSAVNAILADELKRISDEAAAIGLEFDE